MQAQALGVLRSQGDGEEVEQEVPGVMRDDRFDPEGSGGGVGDGVGLGVTPGGQYTMPPPMLMPSVT